MAYSRARIGVIYPSGGLADSEFYRLAPPGVSTHFTRMRFTKAVTEELLDMTKYAKEACYLLASAKLDLIIFHCTAGSFVGGIGYDKEIIKMIEQATNVSATTTSTACVEALRRLGLKKIVMVTPYIEEINRLEEKFLKDSGFELLRVAGAGMTDPYDEWSADPSTWYRLTKQTFVDSADGIFVSCAGIRVIDIIQTLEEDLKKPVVTSNQAAMWDCLRRLKVNTPVSGYGRLLCEPRY